MKMLKVGSDSYDIIFYDIPEIVRIRKYDCDKIQFQKFIKSYKKMTNKKIAQLLNISITEVEHWFRTDKYFSFPSENVWYKLKEVLNIESDIYDSFITEWIEVDGTHEQSNRVYDFNGISPTITSTSADIRILIY
jgi:DNA (cytosine-5)-methyltransferase 1